MRLTEAAERCSRPHCYYSLDRLPSAGAGSVSGPGAPGRERRSVTDGVAEPTTI
jgi:hypothetical protein